MLGEPTYAEGGRTGFKSGQDVKIGDIIKPQISYTKSDKFNIPKTPITSETQILEMLIELDIPITEKMNILAEYKRNKARERIEEQDQELFLGEGGERSRKLGIGYGQDEEGFGGHASINIDTGDPEWGIKWSKKFAKGGLARILGV